MNQNDANKGSKYDQQNINNQQQKVNNSNYKTEGNGSEKNLAPLNYHLPMGHKRMTSYNSYVQNPVQTNKREAVKIMKSDIEKQPGHANYNEYGIGSSKSQNNKGIQGFNSLSKYNDDDNNVGNNNSKNNNRVKTSKDHRDVVANKYNSYNNKEYNIDLEPMDINIEDGYYLSNKKDHPNDNDSSWFNTLVPNR